jgi:hypothetical protein
MTAQGYRSEETNLIRRVAAMPTNCAPARPVDDQSGAGPLGQTAAGSHGLAPRCPACATPVATGTVRVYERGQFFHASCRSRQVGRLALQQADAGGGPTLEAAGAPEDRPVSQRLATLDICPICKQPATVCSFAGAEWYAVDGCTCAGFFVTAEVLEWRLPRLTATERTELVMTLQGFRAMGRDAWLSTGDGSISGRLIIRTQRPGT